ncbi:MAG: hypothetical protein ABI127_09325 [Dokdonella sp.]
MSTKPNPSPSRPASSSQTFSRQKAKPGDRVLTSEAILHDIAEFKKRGGRIDVLGNTPLRTTATSAAFHSRTTAASKKPPTPVDEAGKTAD